MRVRRGKGGGHIWDVLGRAAVGWSVVVVCVRKALMSIAKVEKGTTLTLSWHDVYSGTACYFQARGPGFGRRCDRVQHR